MDDRMLRLRKIFLLGLPSLLLLLSPPLWSRQVLAPNAKRARKVDQYVLDAWRIEDGLPQNSISDFAQTPDGYLWMATFDGLVRFDGVRFTVFNTENTKEMKTSRIEHLFVDHSGALWICPDRTGGESGVLRYKDGRFTAFTPKDGLPRSHVISLSEDLERGIWFKTDGAGLTRFKDGRFTTYAVKDGLPADDINEIHADKQGSVWIGTSKGLAQFKGGRFSDYTTRDGLPSDSIGTICSDTAGNIWIGTNRGLAQFKDHRFKTYSTRDGLPDNAIEHVYADKRGNVWIGTKKGLTRFSGGEFTTYPLNEGVVSEIQEDQEGGLWIRAGEARWQGERFAAGEAPLTGSNGSILWSYKNGKLTSFTSKDGLSDRPIFSFHVDREGSLWIGRSGAGLERLKPAVVATFGSEDGLHDERIRSVFEDKDGSLWIGTQGGGLSRLRDQKLVTYTIKDGLPSNLVWALSEDREGNLWVGTQKGLARLKNGRFISDSAVTALSNEAVLCIHEDRKGNLWIGTGGGGLYRLTGEKAVIYTTKDGLSSDYVKSIHEDPAGAIWLATDDGVTRWKDGRFTVYGTQAGLSNRFVRAIYQDREGTLWFGTYGNGLNRFKDGKFTRYTTEDGLFDHTVSQILEDDGNNFWMTGNKGIYRVKKKELEDFAAGRISSINSVAYGAEEGMKNVECNGGSQPAGWKGKDGKLWFPTMGGVAMVDTKNLKIDQVPPPVMIEQVKVNEKSFEPATEARVPPGRGALEFRYTGLSFLDPQKMKFKYRLKGYDEGWIDAGTRRVARYTNMPPGRYRFQVKAANSDGVWNETGDSFDLYLEPHFYQTVWFYSVCALLFLGAGAGIHRIRIRHLRVHERDLALRVDERTKELKQEIAERGRAEAALRQAEEKYRGIFEEAIVGIFQTTPDGRYLSANPALAQVCGYDSPADLMSARIDIGQQEYVHPARREEFKQSMEQHGIVEKFEYEVYRKDGSTIWISENARAIRDPNGTPLYFIGTVEDITARKRAEEALREAEQNYRTLFENGLVGLFRTTLDGRYLMANSTQARIFGYDSPEELMESITDIARQTYVEPGRRAELARNIGERGAAIEVESQVYRKDGSKIWILENMKARKDSDGRVLGYEGTAVDITERKRAQEELQKAKEAAEVANQAKSAFLANMSHEIRTPMNGIMGMTELVLDTELTPEQRESLELAKLSADSLMGVINDILDFSKIEAGKLDFEAIEFDLRESLGEAIKSLALRAHEKGLELAYDVHAEVPDAVIGDPGRIRQVVINLVGNAIKFTKQGEVELKVEVEEQAEETLQLHFSVHDTGIGIPVEKQQGIFEAFSQADSSTTRQYGGTGLGLTICSRLVEKMGGRIWVESEPGQGSTFHFTMRLGKQKTPASRIVPMHLEGLHGLRVLVVDDNATNRRILAGTLKKWAMAPTAVDGGQAALDTLEKAKAAGETFPLILLDSQMPEMDGFALAERIKQKPELAGATIMMLTSAGYAGDAARCRELGIAVYLVKPVRQVELLEAIRLALGAKFKHRPASALITRHTLGETRRHLQILLAEDNAVNQALAVRLLQKRGHHVVVAANGREALAAFDNQRFDVVLMDVQMPEMDGFQATAAIREKEIRTGTHISIVALTAHAMKGDQERCLAAGMDAYISKPIQASELYAAIENGVRSGTSNETEDHENDRAGRPLTRSQ
jgi:PAS domain S-box-containing protein